VQIADFGLRIADLQRARNTIRNPKSPIRNFDQPPTYGNSAINRARLIAFDTAC
jgi:hypothetical protein